MRAFLEAFRMALRALRSYRMRAFLTMLGITIGIFAITLTFTLVDSMQHSVSKNLSALGPNVMYVHKWPWKDNSEDWQKYINRPRMSYDDYRGLRERLNGIDAISFEATLQGQTARFRELTATNVPVKGVTYDYQTINAPAYSQGRYFTPLEVENGRSVCVIGAGLAKQLFPDRSPLGLTLAVGTMRLQVVGVLAQQGNNLFGQSQDNNLVVPYALFSQHFDLNREGNERVVAVRAARPELISQVEQQIIGTMRSIRGLRPGVEDNFTINKQEELMNQLGQIFMALNIGGLFIAVFALLVGGFGIANIMFVAVKERTREIGIQKALGSSRRFILWQFLIESIVLCLLGAVVGVLLLLLCLWVGGLLIDEMELGLELVVSRRSLTTGLFFAVFTGLLAGILPARAAARLDPVEAIRAGV